MKFFLFLVFVIQGCLNSSSSQWRHERTPYKYSVGDCVRSTSYDAVEIALHQTPLSTGYIHKIIGKTDESYITCQADADHRFFYACSVEDFTDLVNDSKRYRKVQCPDFPIKN